MAQNIINALISSSGFKVVDERTNLQRWAKLKIISVEISVDAESTDLPFASNTSLSSAQAVAALRSDITSGKIIRPSGIRVKAALEDLSNINSLIDVFNDVTHTLQITSKSIISNAMSLVGLSIKQSAESLSSMDIEMTFEQTAPEVLSGFVPRQDGDQSTYGVHVQGKANLTQTVEGLYNKVSTQLGF